MRSILTVFFFTSVIHSSICNLCKICKCSVSDDLIEYNCDGKLDQNSKDLDLFLFIEKDPPDELILSNNGINETSLEKIKYLTALKILDLFHNNITEIDPVIFERFEKLRGLNLSWNLLENFDIGKLEKGGWLEYLNLSNNRIKNVNGSRQYPFTRLNSLYLANNFITSLPENFMDNFPSLTILDLSNNLFTSFENYISNFGSFKSLNLEHNLINSINIHRNLQELRIGFNELTSLPKNLSIESLSIENNRISEIDYDKNLFNELKFLNLSGNSLSIMPNFTLPILKELDISHNAFVSIPEDLMTDNVPSLETLIVNGNPIKELKLFNKLNLRNFIMKNTSLLNAIYADAFENLGGRDGNCINVTISLNKNLNSFDEESIRGMNICYLDLSQNGFTRISKKLENVLNGTLPEYGINLQGNPFICDCKSEWMLEELVPKLYTLNPELLVDLKCASPPELFDKRMVHWLKWKGQVFCEDHLTGNDFSRLEVFDGRDEFFQRRRDVVAIKSGNSMLIIVLSAIISLLLLVVTGMIISHQLLLRKRRSNRRF